MPVHAPDDPAGLPLIVRRDEALHAGLSADQIRQRVRSGRWRRLASGVYLRSASFVEPDEHARLRHEHTLAARAASRAHPDCVIGFGSAAVLRDLPLVTGVPPLVQLLVPEGGWTGIRGGVNFRACQLDASDIERTDAPATTTLRTWLDIARTHRLPDALAAGDRAVALGALSIDDAAWALRQLGSIRGVRLARLALDHLDGRRETPLESWSYAAFLAWQIPLPECQSEFFDDRGFVGRVDFHWREFGVVGEADGRLKYQTPDDLFTEKVREDRLRALGLRVVRWTWADLAHDQQRLRSRLANALRP